MWLKGLYLVDYAAASATDLGVAWGSRGTENRPFGARDETRFAFPVDEASRGEDLDGDGDIDDLVVHLHDVTTRETANLRLGGLPRVLAEHWMVIEEGDSLRVHDLSSDRSRDLEVTGRRVELSGHHLIIAASETERAEDLNGDGDAEDEVWHVHDLVSGVTTNLVLAAGESSLWSRVGDRLLLEVADRDSGWVTHDLASSETTDLRLAVRKWSWFLFGDRLLFLVSENDQRAFDRWADLNGDGDMHDVVWHLLDANGVTTNLGLAGSGQGWERYEPPRESRSGNIVVFPVWEFRQSEDLDGDGMVDNGPGVARAHCDFRRDDQSRHARSQRRERLARLFGPRDLRRRRPQW